MLSAACAVITADKEGIEWNIFEAGAEFEIGRLRLESFQVPHDAADTVGFIIVCDNVRLGVATDMGFVTPSVRGMLSGCDALILETNHDPEMLRQSDRSEATISRILGPSGHLSNGDAAELLAAVLGPRLRAVFLAHLSSDCNTPFLAEQALLDVLKKVGREDVCLVQTHPRILSRIIEISDDHLSLTGPSS